MFVTNKPAMVIDNSLVIADLHLGISKELYDAGISIPKQSKSLAKKINELKKETKTKQLIILGDVKHRLFGTSYQERKEIPEFLSLLKYKNIVLIKGNHDGNIEKLVPKNTKVKKSLSLSDYFLTHGHRKVNTKKENIVIGHNHPNVRFVDDLGSVYIQPVWVIGNIRLDKNHNLIIMPSFNELSGANIVNEKSFMGPVAKRLNKNAHAYLLDGTDLGRLKDL